LFLRGCRPMGRTDKSREHEQRENGIGHVYGTMFCGCADSCYSVML
jgi:hypothetical protein